MRVTRDESYKADVRVQRQWCVKHQRRDYLVGLREALGQAATNLEKFPTMGRDLGDGTRELTLQGLPFVLWYSLEEDPESGDVWLRIEALFHTNQDRPLP